MAEMPTHTGRSLALAARITAGVYAASPIISAMMKSHPAALWIAAMSVQSASNVSTSLTSGDQSLAGEGRVWEIEPATRTGPSGCGRGIARLDREFNREAVERLEPVAEPQGLQHLAGCREGVGSDHARACPNVVGVDLAKHVRM